MFAAFVYKQYYMWGVKDNFRGIYDDADQLQTMLIGNEEYCFLETLNLDTLEFRKYEWKTLYEIKKNIDPETKLDPASRAGILTAECSYKLVKKWTNGTTHPHEEIPFSYEWLSNTVNLDAKMKYYAGYWELER